MRKLFLLIFTLFLVACSNNYVQKNFSWEQQQKLEILNNNIKKNLSLNNIEFIKQNTISSLKNKFLFNEIKDVDFSKINIFMSKPVYENGFAKSILGLNIGDETFYFELIYIYNYSEEKWLIEKLIERR